MRQPQNAVIVQTTNETDDTTPRGAYSARTAESAKTVPLACEAGMPDSLIYGTWMGRLLTAGDLDRHPNMPEHQTGTDKHPTNGAEHASPRLKGSGPVKAEGGYGPGRANWGLGAGGLHSQPP